MTEEALEEAIQTAFPTEPAREALQARIAALTPLRPQPLPLRQLVKRVLAVASLLWICHNIPAAIEIWTPPPAPPKSRHTRHWKVGVDGTYTLTGESWRKGTWQKSIAFRRNRWEASMIRDGKHYYSPPPERIGSVGPGIYNLEDWRARALNTVATLLFRTWDRRSVTHYRGTDLRIVSFTLQNPPRLIKRYIDPKTRRTLLTISKDKEGRITSRSETFYDEPLSDSLFTWEYPLENSFVTEQKTIVESPEEGETRKRDAFLRNLRDVRFWLSLPKRTNPNFDTGG